MLSFVHRRPGFALPALICMLASGCGGGGGQSSSGSVVVPGVSPAPQPTLVGVVPAVQPTVKPAPASSPAADTAAYVCPASDTVTTATSRRSIETGDAVRMMTRNGGATASGNPPPAASQLIAVSYDAGSSAANRTALAARETLLGARRVREYTFAHAGLVTHVLMVPTSAVQRVEAAFAQTAGVRAVGMTGARRFTSSVTQPYFTNDPYFTGFATTTAASASATAPPATFEREPLVEGANVPGQWDMHATRLEYAFAYSQANNGSGVVNPAALGSSAVKLAVIDTGQDTTHPELHAKIAYQRCFITSHNNVQSTSAFTTDEDGHGTDVAGIAGAATNNGLGFSAAGGNVSLYAYRVFPTPDDSCASTKSAANQCASSTQDITSAILDAVNNHVNVISLSLGGSGCADGVDPDPAEGAAVADAIAAGIIVVAAAGNSSGPPVEAPACDAGVIAVGASALADGSANASGRGGGSPAAPLEYVASYTDYGTPGAAAGSSSAWGIVAPGGDPTGANDSDDLHWIENIWTSTPFRASAADDTFAGNCAGDYPAKTGTGDCRVLIAGTSMATPHVAGAAALIIAANPAYQNPALMKQLLCATADDIGDAHEGCGRLDVYRAMATAVGDAAPPPATNRF